MGSSGIDQQKPTGRWRAVQCYEALKLNKCMSHLLWEGLWLYQNCGPAVAYCAFTRYSLTLGRELLFDGQHKVWTRMQWDEQQSSQDRKQMIRGVVF